MVLLPCTWAVHAFLHNSDNGRYQQKRKHRTMLLHSHSDVFDTALTHDVRGYSLKSLVSAKHKLLSLSP